MSILKSLFRISILSIVSVLLQGAGILVLLVPDIYFSGVSDRSGRIKVALGGLLAAIAFVTSWIGTSLAFRMNRGRLRSPTETEIGRAPAAHVSLSGLSPPYQVLEFATAWTLVTFLMLGWSHGWNIFPDHLGKLVVICSMSAAGMAFGFRRNTPSAPGLLDRIKNDQTWHRPVIFAILFGALPLAVLLTALTVELSTASLVCFPLLLLACLMLGFSVFLFSRPERADRAQRRADIASALPLHDPELTPAPVRGIDVGMSCLALLLFLAISTQAADLSLSTLRPVPKKEPKAREIRKGVGAERVVLDTVPLLKFSSEKGAIYLPDIRPDELSPQRLEQAHCAPSAVLGSTRPQEIARAEANLSQQFKPYFSMIYDAIQTKCGNDSNRNEYNMPVHAPTPEIGVRMQPKVKRPGDELKSHKAFIKPLTPTVGVGTSF